MDKKEVSMAEKKYAVAAVPELTIYEGKSEIKETENGTRSAIADEELYGNTLRVFENDGKWCRVMTHYGYMGYVYARELLFTDSPVCAQNKYTVNCAAADILGAPSVSAVRMLTLPKGALIEKDESAENIPDGWSAVKTIDGKRGFIPSMRLDATLYADGYLDDGEEAAVARFEDAGKRKRSARGGMEGFSLRKHLNEFFAGDEEAFRRRLKKTAESYLGTQYRWGGRSGMGVDCSGLVHMSYLSAGIQIFRDAAIADGWPVEKLDIDFSGGMLNLDDVRSGKLCTGDTLYFPGHVAMYLGDGKYIHSTAKTGSNGVVVNSLYPEHEDYRADLRKSLYACGGVR